MRLALRIVGIALIVLGAMFALQGLGILMWPPQSAMLANREWGLYGGVMALLGAVVVWFAGRLGGA
ncbi:MAG: hypothetical protein V2I27_07245 [Erythrobacter sp.]|jgi:hypothetical protein|nr:hypothetical protein [Erythrobacter sp.]